ncbi:ABC transporter ATP-binding protein [uncultured Oscillibacter sp.]|mgnify:CR=1 FL=1|uniref:ABC transporter ATP-binding protein n=1 Tax=uncultured Oscillibacter sp. TaxID=876091 RepID=UPI0025E6767D|nr:ABC transporter ATP-binding protein [uncultured Oscillibacter sp.]
MLEILKKFFRFCGPRERREFYISIALGVAAALLSALRVPAIGVMLQAILTGGVTVKAILLSLGIMLVSVVGSSLLKYRAAALQTDAGYRTTADKRVQIAEHLRYLPMGYFNDNSLGAITSVTTNTMDNLSGVSTRVVMFVTEGLFSTLVMTLAVFLFDWRVGLFIAAGLAVYWLVNRALQRRSEKTTARKLAGDTAVIERVLEFIKGIAEVKSYSLTGKYDRKLETAIDENAAANIDMELKLQPLMWAQNAAAKLMDVGVVVLSLLLYTSGRMELLNCVMMAVCSFLLTEGLEQAGAQSSLLRVVDTCVDQADAILSLPTMDLSGAELTPERHDLRAEDIRFSYGEKQIVNGITLDIPERTTTAIVGPSGGGKTTLCHLLSRFWDVDGGRVTLGGHDVREYDMDSLMRNFSFVFQNVYLFHDTVANNIRFGQPDAPMEAVVAAAKKARCHDFIMKLPQGYDTVIGEAGGSLSGGERQRLSIARAMMKDAPIIILDEATANVDPENEKELMEAVNELTHEKTVIMIAHRLKTVRRADQILVVDRGRIVQRGTHGELMAQEGIYRRFITGRERAVSWKL